MTATEMPPLFKVLEQDRMPMHGGSGQWPEIGQWLTVTGKLVPCANGLHVCTAEQLLQWLGPCIYRVEVKGRVIDHDDKYVVRSARLAEAFPAWDERAMRLFAADCAEHVLYLFERERPDDNRPRLAIEATRQFARGEIDAAARDAAWAAAGDAARAAAGDAARDAAWAAAWAAAGDAAGAAAWAAAGAAAGDAAGDAAWAAERRWQTDLLMRYLRGEVVR